VKVQEVNLLEHVPVGRVHHERYRGSFREVGKRKRVFEDCLHVDRLYGDVSSSAGEIRVPAPDERVPQRIRTRWRRRHGPCV